MAHEDPDLFSVAPPTLEADWTTMIWRMSLLAREAYLEDKDSPETPLRERWDTFLERGLPTARREVPDREVVW